jgi:hypothetical protein
VIEGSERANSKAPGFVDKILQEIPETRSNESRRGLGTFFRALDDDQG